MIDLGSRLKKLMELRDMNQAELARQSEVSKSLISDIINGRNIVTNDTIIKLAKALGAPPSYFIEEDIVTPFDLLPEVPEDIKISMLNEEIIPYLKLSQKAKEKGITPEMLDGLLSTLIQAMEAKPLKK